MILKENNRSLYRDKQVSKTYDLNKFVWKDAQVHTIANLMILGIKLDKLEHAKPLPRQKTANRYEHAKTKFNEHQHGIELVPTSGPIWHIVTQ